MHKEIVITCLPNNNMHWVCIQYIFKKFLDGYFYYLRTFQCMGMSVKIIDFSHRWIRF